jgi:transcriptional regulator with XRE-family HTH domain
MRYLRGLREARERALLTQAELAEQAGITTSTISRLETGVQAARLSTLRKIAAAVRVNPETLIDWERPAPQIGGRGTGKAA